MAGTKFDPNNFIVGKNYVLEASAGTGKTYNIVEIVKKLAGSGVKLETLLIVTYTEKAAGELKDRIRKALPGKNVEEAFIGTIHSFCQNTLEEFCVAAGKPSELTLIDESECRSFVQRYIREGNIAKDIADLKVALIKSDPKDEKDLNLEEKLIKKFTAVLENYYLDASWKEVPEIVSLKKPDPEWLKFAKGSLIYDSFSGLQHDLELFRDSSSTDLNGLYQPILDLLKENSLNFQKPRNIEKRLEGPDLEVFRRVLALREKIKKFDGRAYRLNGLVIEYAVDIYRKWQEEKEKRGAQTFNDMLRSVRENVVNGGLLLAKLKEKYEYAIIDEFQDTNQKQWDIFRNVFLLNGAEPDPDHHIIVVGDPKQSIYSFQGADLFVYEKAKQEIVSYGGEECILGDNYRASKDVIDSTGIFFDTAAVKSHQGFADFARSGCGKPNLRMQYEGSDKNSFWIFGDNTSDSGLYAESVCKKIVDCCSYDGAKTKLTVFDENGKERNVTFRDFTILAKTRSELAPFIRTLERCGIPYLTYKDNSLFSDRECAHWAAILDAVASPDFTGTNRKKFRKALFTSFFGYSLKEISSAKYDKDNIDEITWFDKWKKLASEEKWEELITSIMTDTGVEKKLGGLRDLKSLGAVRQLADVCADYLSSGHTLPSLVNYLRNRLNGAAGEEGTEDDSLIAKGTDFDCVKVMTIHASKGLEFPVVISAAGFKGNKKTLDIYSYHADEQFTISFESPEGTIYLDEQDNEIRRLIYVAYTRAKYVLMLPGCTLSSDRQFLADDIATFRGEGCCREYAVAPVDFALVKRQVKDILKCNRPVTAGAFTKDDQEKEIESLKDKKFWRSAWKHAYSSLSHEKKKKEVLSEDGILQDNGEEQEKIDLAAFDSAGLSVTCSYDRSMEPQMLPDGFPAGTGLGNALHEIFEKIDYQDTAVITDDFLRGCYKGQGLRSRKDPTLASWILATREMIKNVTGATLPVIHGNTETGESMTLGEIPFADRKNEAEFNFNKEGQKLHHYFNGFIDLVFRRGEYYSILDWKSDRLNDDFTSYSEAEPMKDHVDSLYAIQRVLYSYTLIKWLQQFYGGTEQEIFEKHFGGVYYVFLRGCNAGSGNGIYAQTWENWDALKAAYDGIVSAKVKG